MKQYLLLVAGIVFVLTSCGKPPDAANSKYAALAQCLTEKGVKEYGAFWCPHCAKQREMFGDAYQYITYVECDPRGTNANPKECQDKDIGSYPTWIFPDGTRVSGEQELRLLADKTDCSLETVNSVLLKKK